jgi:hypothetical protein
MVPMRLLVVAVTAAALQSCSGQRISMPGWAKTPDTFSVFARGNPLKFIASLAEMPSEVCTAQSHGSLLLKTFKVGVGCQRVTVPAVRLAESPSIFVWKFLTCSTSTLLTKVIGCDLVSWSSSCRYQRGRQGCDVGLDGPVTPGMS